MNLLKQKRTLLTIITAVIMGVGAWATYAIFSTNLTTADSKDTEKSQKLFTKVAANEIEQYFYDIEKRLETIALAPSVRNAQRSEACNQNLQDILEVNKKEFSNLGRISKDGIFICAVNRTIVGEPVSKYGDYFKRIAEDPKHQTVMSNLIYPTGSGGPVVGVHVPVYDAQGKFNGTIGGAVYFDELQDRILRDDQPSKNSILSLYDDNLDILYHPDPLIRSKKLLSSEVLKLYSPRSAMTDLAKSIQKAPAEGTVDYSLRGEPYHMTYRSAPVIGRYWTVSTAMPRSDIEQSAQRSMLQLSLAVVLAVIALLATALLHSSLRPVTPSKSPRKA